MGQGVCVETVSSHQLQVVSLSNDEMAERERTSMPHERAWTFFSLKLLEGSGGF